MSLGDILKGLSEDPEEQRRKEQLVDDLSSLKDRLAKDPANVSEDEVVTGIRKQFELMLSGDFLEEASWLMDSLSFTRSASRHDEIATAWEVFQKNQLRISELRLDEYPILEGIAHWYFDHRDDQGRDENAMVARSLAMYEYLFQELRGHEAEYEDILAENGVDVLYLYCWLGLFERAKFYAQVLEIEYRAGRLDGEDFESVQRTIATIRHNEATEQADRDRITRLQWDTLADRDRRIQEFERRLGETAAHASTQTDIDRARERVSKKLGALWNRLHPETRKHLAVADAFSEEPLSKNHPDIPPCYFFKALNAELQARLFKPTGQLEPQILVRLGVHTPAALLIEFDRNVMWTSEDRDAVRHALDTIGSRQVICSRPNVERLRHLRNDRNSVEHPERRKKAYNQEQLQDLLRAIWKNNWLVGFLRQLHGR